VTPGTIVIDGQQYRLEQVGRVDKPSFTDTYWQVEGDKIEHPTVYLDPAADDEDLREPDDPGWYDACYRLVPVDGDTAAEEPAT
jgi:hypothetical protein